MCECDLGIERKLGIFNKYSLGLLNWKAVAESCLWNIMSNPKVGFQLILQQNVFWMWAWTSSHSQMLSKWELSLHRGKLRAIAQCEHCKVTYQQNSSLTPQDSSLVCSGHAFQQNYNGESAICEESVEHNSVRQLEHPCEQTGSALGRVCCQSIATSELCCLLYFHCAHHVHQSMQHIIFVFKVSL